MPAITLPSPLAVPAAFQRSSSRCPRRLARNSAAVASAVTGSSSRAKRSSRSDRALAAPGAIRTGILQHHGIFRHPGTRTEQSEGRRYETLAASFAGPLFLPSDPWVVWAALAAAGAAGLWSEKTKVGKALSGALVATLLGLLMSNLGLIPCDAPQYCVVNKMLLPLAIPMLLFSADLRRVFFDTGKLLSVFMLGSVATILSTLAAFKLMPLASLGAEGWKVAAALCARHIGGAVNYVGVVETLGVSPASQAAGLAADNLICALYFTTLYWLARSIPADAAEPAAAPVGSDGKEAGEGRGGGVDGEAGSGIGVLEGGTAIALSALLCMLGTAMAKVVGYSGLAIPIITLLAVLLATAIPTVLRPLVSSGEGLAALIMQVFFATVGANGNISSVIGKAPSLFIFALLQVGLHVVFILLAGKAFRIDLRDVLLASNANVGGPTTAAGMAAAKGWRRSVVPALLVGTFGYAIATFVSIALGFQVLKPMAFSA